MSAPKIAFSMPRHMGTLKGSINHTSAIEVKGTGIDRVIFYCDGEKLNSDANPPWRAIIDTRKWPDGEHTLMCKAWNRAGEASSTTRRVIFDNHQATPDEERMAEIAELRALIDEHQALITQQEEETEVLRLKLKHMRARLDQLEGVIPPPPPDPEIPPDVPDPNLPISGTAIPTFHCCSLKFRPPNDPGSQGVLVEYKKASDSAWSTGHPLWYDPRNSEARGSLVHLTPNTNYQVRFSMPGENPSAQLSFTTWSETFPVKSTTTLAAGTVGSQVFSVGGDANDGYVVYEAHGSGTTIQAPSNNDRVYAVRVRASYVIVRGFNIRGGEDGILIDPGVHHVVIEDNDIADWCRSGGKVSPEGWALGQDDDSAIKLYNEGGNAPDPALLAQSTNIVIQRNKIHEPRFGTNSWQDEHPLGPCGIFMVDNGGSNVIRYNEITSNSAAKWYKDCMHGNNNFSFGGFPGPNSDIYMNKLGNCWDDAIEAEGGGENVRIWKNYGDRMGVFIATTVVAKGPLYCWRNVGNRQKHLSRVTPDNDQRNKGFKAYTQGSWGNGRRYKYHNTLLQWPGASEGATNGLGCGEGLAAGDSGLTETKSRNNIYQVWKADSSSIRRGGPSDPSNASNNDLDYDLRNGVLTGLYAGAETHVGDAKRTPIYKSGHGPTTAASGKVQLDPTSPGHDQGEIIPNFNDGYLGAAPDVGAHEEGSADMVFGITATGS